MSVSIQIHLIPFDDIQVGVKAVLAAVPIIFEVVTGACTVCPLSSLVERCSFVRRTHNLVRCDNVSEGQCSILSVPEILVGMEFER